MEVQHVFCSGERVLIGLGTRAANGDFAKSAASSRPTSHRISWLVENIVDRVVKISTVQDPHTAAAPDPATPLVVLAAGPANGPAKSRLNVPHQPPQISVRIDHKMHMVVPHVLDVLPQGFFLSKGRDGPKHHITLFCVH
jgi:hypothetical protein